MSRLVSFNTEQFPVRSGPAQELVEMEEVTPLDDLVNKVMACTETEQDVETFIDQFSDRFPLVGRFCCCSRLYHRSFTLTALALLFNLRLRERFSLVLGFWFLAISVMIWLFGSANKLVFILLLSMIVGVLSKCTMDDEMQLAALSSNRIVKMATAMYKCVEEITNVLLLLLTVPFSMLETIWLKGLRFEGVCPRRPSQM